MRILPALFVSSLMATQAMAAVHMNAMCILKSKESKAQAFNPTSEEIKESGLAVLRKIPTKVTDADIRSSFRIASLSKVYTSQWALNKLGPEYRFTTKVSLIADSRPGVCRIHFSGDMDPIVGREVLTEVFADIKERLNQQSCSRVSAITFDENFRVLLNVMSHHTSSSALQTYGWSNPARYDNLDVTKADLAAFVKYKSGLGLTGEEVSYLAKVDFLAANYIKKDFFFQSRPLAKILKDLNKYSHNYIANVIFNRLGGARKHAEFMQKKFGLTTNQVLLLNGSGYPVEMSEGKIYNEASCESLVRVMQDMDQTLRSYKSVKIYQLADVMPVGGPDEDYSTFKHLYSASVFDNSLVAKTGSADKAITFGGMLMTSEGPLYFGAFTAPDRYGSPDLPVARDYIRALMGVLIERVKVKKFDYNVEGPISPVDDAVKLREWPTSGGLS